MNFLKFFKLKLTPYVLILLKNHESTSGVLALLKRPGNLIRKAAHSHSVRAGLTKCEVIGSGYRWGLSIVDRNGNEIKNN